MKKIYALTLGVLVVLATWGCEPKGEQVIQASLSAYINSYNMRNPEEWINIVHPLCYDGRATALMTYYENKPKSLQYEQAKLVKRSGFVSHGDTLITLLKVKIRAYEDTENQNIYQLATSLRTHKVSYGERNVTYAKEEARVWIESLVPFLAISEDAGNSWKLVPDLKEELLQNIPLNAGVRYKLNEFYQQEFNHQLYKQTAGL